MTADSSICTETVNQLDLSQGEEFGDEDTERMELNRRIHNATRGRDEEVKLTWEEEEEGMGDRREGRGGGRGKGR